LLIANNFVPFSSSVPGDKSAMNPSGIRIGLPPLTTRYSLKMGGFQHAGMGKNKKVTENFPC